PVSVSISGRVASVGISLLRPEALALVQRSLELALEEHDRGESAEDRAPAQPSHPEQQAP
ncbi:MAG TPA: hypothetical protein VG963_32065, partial [Polyangiaceae bacterium]|nr:hypothetical protein [Polyangiaceae bacterium]